MKTNTIVKQIHESFSNGEEQIMAQVREVLKNAEDSEVKGRADKLRALGFTNAKPVVDLSDEAIAKAKLLENRKKTYDRIAPQYKFITQEKLDEICERFGIVYGEINRYTGDIPVKNQEDIINFKVLDESFLESNMNASWQSATWTDANGVEHTAKSMGDSYLINTINFIMKKHRTFGTRFFRSAMFELHKRGMTEEIESVENKMHFSRSNYTQQFIDECIKPENNNSGVSFTIAADIDSFDLTDAKLDGNRIEDQRSKKIMEDQMAHLLRQYDPIVLARVQDGYLIVTAWGDEASDPDVINPKMN